MVETTATYPNGRGGMLVNTAPQPETVWHEVAKLMPAPYDMAPLDPSMPADLAGMFTELMGIWAAHLWRNQRKYRYYDCKNKLKDFGISTPPTLLDVEVAFDWPNKAVTALADRVRFDGFTAKDADVQKRLDAMTRRAGFMRRMRFLPHSEGIYGFYIGTVGTDADGNAQMDFYDAEHSAAVWDAAKGRIAYGMVIDAFSEGMPVAARVFTDEYVYTMTLDRVWRWDYQRITMGRIPMEAFTYRPTDRKPFGQSRISRAVISITDSAMRAALGADIAFQFSVAPQKFLLGAADDPFKNKTRWEAFIGNIFAVGYNGKQGVMPQFGQLPQPSMQQSADMMRMLAARFSGATNIPISQLGIIHDQPASAEAIYAANEPLVIEATDLIEGNRETMKVLARMCIAAEYDVPLDGLTDDQLDIMPNYRNPAMPSVVSQADAAVKIASAVPEFAGTAAWWKMVGMPEDTRREIENEIAARNAQRLFEAMFDENGNLIEGATGNVTLDAAGNPVYNDTGMLADDKSDLTRLNGSQMNVLINLVTQAREGTMSRDQAERLMRVGFKLSDDDIRTLFGSM